MSIMGPTFSSQRYPGKTVYDLQIVMFYLLNHSVAYLADSASGSLWSEHVKT